MAAFLRGQHASVELLNSVIERLSTTLTELNANNTDAITAMKRDLNRLERLRDIIDQPSKGDMCVEALRPCLTSGELQDVKVRFIVLFDLRFEQFVQCQILSL